MLSCLEYCKPKIGLHLILPTIVYVISIGAAYAQNIPQDAISKSIEEQIQIRQMKFAQFDAQQNYFDARIGSAGEMSTGNTVPKLLAQPYMPQSTGYAGNESAARDINKSTEGTIALNQAPTTLPDDTVFAATSSGTMYSTEALQNQINALQKEVAQLQATERSPARTEVQNQASDNTSTSGEKSGSLHNTIKTKTGVDVTLGGWFDGTAVYRSKNESADFISNINTAIPFNNAANAHQSEFRETARATRVRLTVAGSPDADTKLGAFVESDFHGAASTATSTSTNGYTPRLYQGFFTYDRNDLGLHAMAGQAFSMLTMNKTGIDPMTTNIPLTIDASYSAGFNYTRNPQLRLVEDFDDKKLWVGISAESPQAVVSGLPCTANASSGNCAGFNSTYSVTSAPNSSSFANNVTTDTAPDVILKTAYDPGWGHYEIFGIVRFFHDNVDASLHNNVVAGGGGGASMLLPVVRQYLDFQAQFMAGDGIGRYGSAQLPDFAIMPDGSLKPIHEQTAMAGVVGHPDPSWDLYLYSGEEKAFRQSSNLTAYGYGDAGTANSGCYITGGSCSASTSSVFEFVVGFWKRLYDGNYGKVQIGMQNSVIRRNTFGDNVGSAPHAYEDVAMTSFRYFPF